MVTLDNNNHSRLYFLALLSDKQVSDKTNLFLYDYFCKAVQ